MTLLHCIAFIVFICSPMQTTRVLYTIRQSQGFLEKFVLRVMTLHCIAFIVFICGPMQIIYNKTKSRFLEKFVLRVMTLDCIAFHHIHSIIRSWADTSPTHISPYICLCYLAIEIALDIPIESMMVWAYADSTIDMCSCSYSPLKIDRTKCTNLLFIYLFYFFANIWK